MSIRESKILAIALILVGTGLAAQLAYASGTNQCMSRHLEEAIALNKERRPLYAEQDWRAYVVSTLLIWSEKWSLRFIAPRFDEEARTYQDHGVGVLCDEFIDMAQAPQFVAKNPEAPSIEDYQAPDVKSIVRALSAAIEK